jgi:hypothetical protein
MVKLVLQQKLRDRKKATAYFGDLLNVQLGPIKNVQKKDFFRIKLSLLIIKYVNFNWWKGSMVRAAR